MFLLWLWTSQRIGFYKDVVDAGIAYCDRLSYWSRHNSLAYNWIADQMRQRIGPPPLPQITLPVWAWYQYDSKKRNKPPLSPKDKTHYGKEMMMEIEVPDNEVLLSDFSMWMHPLNGWDLLTDRKLRKKVEEHFFTEFDQKPPEIQKLIMDSWVKVFDLKTIDKYYAPRPMKNRSIQATLWCVKKEYLISAVKY